MTAVPFTDGREHLHGAIVAIVYLLSSEILRRILTLAFADLQRYGRTTFPVNVGQLQVE